MPNKRVYKQAIDKWGQDAQLDLLAEECLECALAVHRYKRARDYSFSGLINEMADVEIMLEQIKVLLCEGNDKDVFKIAKNKKLKRLKQRLK